MRRALLLTIAIALIAAVGVFAFRYYATARLERARTQFQAEIGSLDPASYAPEEVDSDSNAAHWILAGSNALGSNENVSAVLKRRAESKGAPWSADDEAAFLALRTEIEPARAQLNRALALELSSQGLDYDAPIADAMDHLAVFRAARLVVLESDYERSGDPPASERDAMDAAIERAMLLERMAAVERREPILMKLLLGSAIERMYHGQIETLLGGVAETSDLDRLDESLRHLERSAAPIRRALAFETAFVHAAMVDPMRGAIEPASSRREVDRGDEIGARLQSFLRLDHLQLARFIEASARLAQRAEEPFAGVDGETWLKQETNRAWLGIPGVLTTVLLPNQIDIIKKDQIAMAERRLAATALELRRVKLDTGAYPESLANPPVSAFTGEAASYRRLEDGGVEIAFPESQRAWEAMWTHGPPTASAPPNLSWRLPA